MKTAKNTIPQPSRRHDSSDILLRYASFLGCSDFHIKIDKATGLKAIIAINSTKRGPAIGGCRMLPYQSTLKAFEDVFRLSYGMTLKAAISNLPNGGSKSVLIQPKVIQDREAYFAKFAEAVNELGGRYVVGADSGTGPEEMDIIARYSKYVTCTTATGDPSPYTALGVLRGIEASVKFKMGRASLEGVRVAIQGTGHIGYELAKLLKDRGAQLIVCDTNKKHLDHCTQAMNVDVCSPEDIYDVPADVFAPCALGSVLNVHTIRRLKARIIAGGANNQLTHAHYGKALHEKGFLYSPDFVINAGGLIQAAMLYTHQNTPKAHQHIQEQIDHIYDTLSEIFERSKKENIPTEDIATKIALERLSLNN